MANKQVLALLIALCLFLVIGHKLETETELEQDQEQTKEGKEVPETKKVEHELEDDSGEFVGEAPEKLKNELKKEDPKTILPQLTVPEPPQFCTIC